MPEIFHSWQQIFLGIKSKLDYYQKILLRPKRSDPSLVKSAAVLLSICWCGYYMIQYSIYNNFSVFCKNFNLKTMEISKQIKTAYFFSPFSYQNFVLWISLVDIAMFYSFNNFYSLSLIYVNRKEKIISVSAYLLYIPIFSLALEWRFYIFGIQFKKFFFFFRWLLFWQLDFSVSVPTTQCFRFVS